MKMEKRGVAIHIETLTYWLIGIAIFILGIGIILVLKDKDMSAIAYVKNLLRGFGLG